MNSELRDACLSVAETLSARILVLMRKDPKVADITDAFDLFAVPGFECLDLAPSLAQAGWALAKARRDFAAEGGAR